MTTTTRNSPGAENEDWDSKNFLSISNGVAKHNARLVADDAKAAEARQCVDEICSSDSDIGRGNGNMAHPGDMFLDDAAVQDNLDGQAQGDAAGGDMACDAEQEQLASEQEVERKRAEIEADRLRDQLLDDSTAHIHEQNQLDEIARVQLEKRNEEAARAEELRRCSICAVKASKTAMECGPSLWMP